MLFRNVVYSPTLQVIKFSLSSDKPMNTLNELFAGAFKKNHRNVKPEQIDKMQALFADKDKLIETLFSMYSETIETLTTNDPSEDRENLITWSVGE